MSHYTARIQGILAALAFIGGVYMVVEHRIHLLAALPIVVLLACPLMHVFMHRNHHRHPPQN